MPAVHPELCTSRLLVMERLDGTPVAQASAVIDTTDADVRETSAQRLLTTVLGQILTDGIFHADLHAGNVLVWPDGDVGLLDFGSVGRLDSPSRQALATLLWSIDADDPVLATSSGGPVLSAGVSALTLMGYLLAFAGLMLALRAVALIFGRPPR